MSGDLEKGNKAPCGRPRLTLATSLVAQWNKLGVPMKTMEEWEKNTEFPYLVLNYPKCVIVIIVHVQLYSVWLTAILYHTLRDTVVAVIVIFVVVDVLVGCCSHYRRRC